jgi:hypothetical protein
MLDADREVIDLFAQTYATISDGALGVKLSTLTEETRERQAERKIAMRDRARQLAAQGREDEADRLFRQAWLLESQQDTPEPDRGVIEVVKG